MQHTSKQIPDDIITADISRYSTHKKSESSLNLPVLKSVLASPPLSARIWSHDHGRLRHSADEYTGHSKPHAAPGRAHSADHIHDKTMSNDRTTIHDRTTPADILDSRPDSRDLQVTSSPSSFSSEPIMVNHRQTDFTLNGHHDNRSSPGFHANRASPRTPVNIIDRDSDHSNQGHSNHKSSLTNGIDSSKSATQKDIDKLYDSETSKESKPDFYNTMADCSSTPKDERSLRQHNAGERSDKEALLSSHHTASHDNTHSEHNTYGLSKSQYQSESYKTPASDSIHNHDRDRQSKDNDKYSRPESLSDKNQNYEKHNRVNFHDIKDVAMGADKKENERANDRVSVFKGPQTEGGSRERQVRDMGLGGGPHMSPRDGMGFGSSHAGGYPHGMAGTPGYPGPHHPSAGAGPPSGAPPPHPSTAPPHPAYMPFPPSAAAAMHPALLYQYNQYAAGLHLAQLQHLQMAQAAQAAQAAHIAHAQQLHSHSSRGQHMTQHR